MTRRRHPRLHRLVASLMLVALLLHALVPAGFMPGAGGDGDTAVRASGWLAICPASQLAVALKARADAAPAPTGPICHGGRQIEGATAARDAAADAGAAVPHRDPAADPHDCPFAASGAAALPANAARSEVPIEPATAIPAANGIATCALLRRLPPSRGPPPKPVVPPLQG